MFVEKSDKGYIEVLEGVQRKTLVYGQKTLMTEFRLAEGSLIPSHQHPHEQTGYMVSGKIRLLLEDQKVICTAGDSWCLAGNAAHGVEVLEEAVVVEVFSPVREDYLP